MSLDRARAERTRDEIVKSLGREPDAVLDVGGGDGKLLAPFGERGTGCFLLDYNKEPRQGVERLGSTLGDLDESARFDAVILGHVLEHVAEPLRLLTEAARHVSRGGVVFSEVPLEIWRGLPIGRDPVTHINFFTRGTLADLHERAGLGVISARQFRGSYGETRKEVATVVATNADSSPQWRGRGLVEAQERVEPSFAARARRAARERPKRFARRLRVRAANQAQ